MNKAVFIDKDGTLITDVPYNVDPQQIRLEPGAAAALQRLQNTGYLLVIISNQAGLALGYFEEKDLEPVSKTIQRLLYPHGVKIKSFYYCPHHPQGKVEPYNVSCTCRKPEAGMLLQAAEDLEIDLQQSWMVGDILNDVEAGNKAGCQTILIDSGGETEWLPGANRTPHFTVKGWKEVPDIVESAILQAAHEPLEPL